MSRRHRSENMDRTLSSLLHIVPNYLKSKNEFVPDPFELPFFEQVILIILGVAVTAISGAIIGHFRTKSQCFQAMKDKMEKLDKRSFRIEKALILSMGMIDSQTMDAHPETKSQLNALVKEIMLDEEGKL